MGAVDQVATAVGTEGIDAIRDVEAFIEETAARLPAGWASGYLNVLADDVRRVTGALPRHPTGTVVPLRAHS